MKKLFALFTVALFIFSCSNEQEEEVLEATNAGGLVIVCQGYGIFPNHDYDCGWKRGYDDWVYHYNWVVQSEGLPECNKIQVATIDGSVRIVWNDTTNGFHLIQLTQNTFQSYYDNLFNDMEGDWNQGKIAGYLAGRGQMPYAENNEEPCF